MSFGYQTLERSVKRLWRNNCLYLFFVITPATDLKTRILHGLLFRLLQAMKRRIQGSFFHAEQGG